MKVSVFGLGYVGSVMMGCLSKVGHEVMGVDVQSDRVAQFLAGVSPVVEPGVQGLISQGLKSKRISATTDPAQALHDCEICFVCVGTPSCPDGSLNISAVESVCQEIGTALRHRQANQGQPPCVVIRSTVMPGTFDRCLGLLTQASLSSAGEKFVLCINPEFLREGSAISDFMDPPYTLVGTPHVAWAEPIKRLYQFLNAPFLVTEVGVAEILKIVSNCWHATKVCFGNEVGRLCKELHIDPHQVMELFIRDARLNLSKSYLRPGFAYGGSCLPKDVGAINHLAEQTHLDLPLFQGVPQSNRLHLEKAKEYLLSSGCKRIGFVGLTFKPETDDLRGSPQMDLVEYCLGKGMAVHIFDPMVRPDRLVGSNRRYTLEHVSHLAELLVARIEDLEGLSELLVIGHRDKQYAEFCRGLPKEKTILDLAGVVRRSEVQARYIGLCW